MVVRAEHQIEFGGNAEAAVELIQIGRCCWMRGEGRAADIDQIGALDWLLAIILVGFLVYLLARDYVNGRMIVGGEPG